MQYHWFVGSSLRTMRINSMSCASRQAVVGGSPCKTQRKKTPYLPGSTSHWVGQSHNLNHQYLVSVWFGHGTASTPQKLFLGGGYWVSWGVS